MTFLTRCLPMQTGQRITRFRMIELFNLDRLPVLEIVALQAICPQPSFVFVPVAGDTAWRKTQKRPVQIFDLDGRTLSGRYFTGEVAFIAAQTRVLAFEYVSRLLVVESLGIPFDDGEVLAVVLRVAAHALLARSRSDLIGSVQPLSIGQASGDLGVAIQAFEVGLTRTQLMASGAVGSAVQRLMRMGKRAGRNLRCRRNSEKQNRARNNLQH